MFNTYFTDFKTQILRLHTRKPSVYGMTLRLALIVFSLLLPPPDEAVPKEVSRVSAGNLTSSTTVGKGMLLLLPQSTLC